MAKKDVVTDKEIVKDLITAHKNPPNKPGSKYDLTFFYYLVAFMLLIIELKHPKFILWVLIALIIVGAIGSIVYKIRLTHLKKTFSKYSGIGIKNFYNTMIMNKAKSLLRAGYSVSETASALHFENTNYFSTAFKRITGNSPSHYKKSSN